MMKVKRFSIKFLLLCTLVTGKMAIAQNTDSTQFKKVYSLLNDALKEPLKVYRLNLSNLPIDSFPIPLAKFKNLQHLYLNYDHLEFIPREIADLENLRVLQLNGDNFKTLPIEFSNLKNLEEVSLNVNTKMNLSQSVKVLSTLPKLHILHLENDELIVLPSNFSTLKHLEKLYLNNNKLTEVPSQIKGMKSLKYLDMQYNNIPTIKMNDYHAFAVKIKF